MARRKRRSTGTRARSTTASRAKRANNKQDMNLSIIGTIIFSVLLAVLLYTNSGEIGQKLNELLGGLMGVLRYVLPIGTFAIAIKMACKEEGDYVTKRLVEYAILLICIAIIMSVYEISSGNIEVAGDMSQNLKAAYALGVVNKGGGAIGTLAAIFLVKMLGNLGAVVLSVGVSIMLFAFVCGIDISEFISRKVEEHIEKKEEQKIEREERRKEREQYLAIQREEIIAERKKKHQEQEQNKMRNSEIAAIQDIQNQKIEPEQIKINLNGRVVEDEPKASKKGLRSLLKKQKNEEKSNIAETANSIMTIDKETGEILEQASNLFVQEEEQKQDKTKQVLQLEHTISVEEEHYVFPPIDILSKMEKASLKGGTKSLTDTATRLQKTLYSFGVSAKVENVTVGPAITRYELKPAEGVRVSKIANLADDIALNLAAETIRIEAPIPGKQAVRNRSTK
jgi:S-DNA-T family DNA segregation ATPase FtsK/SpoIIIE